MAPPGPYNGLFQTTFKPFLNGQHHQFGVGGGSRELLRGRGRVRKREGTLDNITHRTQSYNNLPLKNSMRKEFAAFVSLF